MPANYLRALCIHQRQFLRLVSSEPFDRCSLLEALVALSLVFRWIEPCVRFMTSVRDHINHGVCAGRTQNIRIVCKFRFCVTLCTQFVIIIGR